jgi:hypothetical protein
MASVHQVPQSIAMSAEAGVVWSHWIGGRRILQYCALSNNHHRLYYGNVGGLQPRRRKLYADHRYRTFALVVRYFSSVYIRLRPEYCMWHAE